MLIGHLQCPVCEVSVQVFLPITETELPLLIDLWEFPIYSRYNNFVIYGLETFPSSMWLAFTVS